MSSSPKSLQKKTEDRKLHESLPLTLMIIVQSGYDENTVLTVIEEQQKRFSYVQLIVYQQVERDLSTSFLQVLRSNKIVRKIHIWDETDSELTLEEKIRNLRQVSSIHLLLFTVPKNLQELAFIFRREQSYRDFPEDIPLSFNLRKSLSKKVDKDLINTIQVIESTWAYTYDGQCIHDGTPVSAKELSNIFARQKNNVDQNNYQQQFVNHSNAIIVWQILRNAPAEEIKQFHIMYKKNLNHEVRDLDDIHIRAINDYLFSTEVDLATKIARWVEFVQSGHQQAITMIAKAFKDLNTQLKDMKVKDMVMLATAFGNNIEHEN